MQEDEKSGGVISRRGVLAGATFIPVAALTAAAQAAESALSQEQRQILDAFVDRLVPRDELGAGALECGAANYIDLALADVLSAEKGAIAEGLAAVDSFSWQQHGGGFISLTPEKKDEVLTAFEAGRVPGFANAAGFFGRVRRLTLEGMFGDPHYGGNKNFAGWDLIRYPGPRLAVGPEDQRMNVAPRPLHQSVYGR